MKLAVLGTGEVGQALATAFAKLGHHVRIGSRTNDNTKAAAWAAANDAGHGDFADVAAYADLIIVAISGLNVVAALEAAGESNVDGKIVVDVSNPLDMSGGFPPKVVIPAEGSVGASIQARFPGAKVVKTLNTVNNAVMINPGSVPGHHNLFLSGDDAEAKAVVGELLMSLGWKPEQLLDLGGIATARGPEQLLPLWCDLLGAYPGKAFNIGVAHE